MSKENNFTIRDNNSEFAKYLPEKWIEPLVIIARMEGYNVDDYILSLIKDRLEMFVDTRDELGEPFRKYMQGIEGLEDLSTTAAEEDSNKEEDNTSEFVKDVDENYHDLKKQQSETNDKDLEDLK